MQFPVPQFTDVEDRIIANLTIKQFGILFGAGVIIFIGYSASKSILVIIFLFVLFGIPALAVAFGKVNGRPVYNTFPILFRYFTGDKFFIFKKEAKLHEIKFVKNAEPDKTNQPQETGEQRKKRVLELQLGLSKASEEREALLRKRP